MLQAGILAAAISVLVAACALVSQPPPPGTRMVRVQVKNTAAVPVELAVTSGSAVLPGAVQPSTLGPNALAPITFYLPPGDDWSITSNGMLMFDGPSVDEYVRQGCQMGMEVSTDGSGGIGCFTPR